MEYTVFLVSKQLQHFCMNFCNNSVICYRQNIPDKEVTVAITPNGLADGITKRVCDVHGNEECFVMPEEVNMKIKDFLDNLQQPK